MNKITPFAPAIALAFLLSTALMTDLPSVPRVAEATLRAKDKKDQPKEPKRIFDRRIAWGPAPAAANSWDHILAQYGE